MLFHQDMKIHVYSICWNEELMLPFFLRHYETFAEKIFIYDNYSDDSSQDIINAHPKAELRFFDTGGKAVESKEIRVKGQAWKESKKTADWVINVDTDEFLYHPDIMKYLKDCKKRGISIPKPTGYDMVSDEFPTHDGQIYETVTRGWKWSRYDKFAIFDPAKIKDIYYSAGCHSAKP